MRRIANSKIRNVFELTEFLPHFWAIIKQFQMNGKSSAIVSETLKIMEMKIINAMTFWITKVLYLPCVPSLAVTRLVPILRCSPQKNWSFPLSVSSVNVNKSDLKNSENADLVTSTEEILSRKFHSVRSGFQNSKFRREKEEKPQKKNNFTSLSCQPLESIPKIVPLGFELVHWWYLHTT